MTDCTCVHVCVLGTKVPPLETVHRSQVALLSICEPKVVQEVPGPVGIPNLHPFCWELLGIRRSLWPHNKEISELNLMHFDTNPQTEMLHVNLKGNFTQSAKKIIFSQLPLEICNHVDIFCMISEGVIETWRCSKRNSFHLDYFFFSPPDMDMSKPKLSAWLYTTRGTWDNIIMF